jgi:hypothetical protein
MVDTGWKCGTCGRLNFSHRTACKVCKGTVRSTSMPPRNRTVLSAKTSGTAPHPLLLFAIISGAVAFMLSVCLPLAYISLPLMALSNSTTSEMLFSVLLGIIGVGILGVFIFVAGGARFLDR